MCPSPMMFLILLRHLPNRMDTMRWTVFEPQCLYAELAPGPSPCCQTSALPYSCLSRLEPSQRVPSNISCLDSKSPPGSFECLPSTVAIVIKKVKVTLFSFFTSTILSSPTLALWQSFTVLPPPHRESQESHLAGFTLNTAFIFTKVRTIFSSVLLFGYHIAAQALRKSQRLLFGSRPSLSPKYSTNYQMTLKKRCRCYHQASRSRSRHSISHLCLFPLLSPSIQLVSDHPLITSTSRDS